MPVECYELVISGTLSGQFVQTVLHLNADNSGAVQPFAMADDLLQGFCTAGNVLELFCDMLPQNYAITSARCRRILATGGPTQIYLPASMAESVGQRTGDISSAQVNPLLIWLTTQNPTKTGRTFLPGVSEDDIDQMQLAVGLTGAMGLFGNLWRDGDTTPLNGVPWTGAVYRRALADSDAITNFRISPLIGTQRRRLRPY